MGCILRYDSMLNVIEQCKMLIQYCIKTDHGIKIYKTMLDIKMERYCLFECGAN